MTIARQALKAKKVRTAKVVNLAGKTVYLPPDQKKDKHYAFRPGGVYYEEG